MHTFADWLHAILIAFLAILFMMTIRQSSRNRQLARAKRETTAFHKGWRKQVGDGRIFDALCLAYANVPESRPYIKKFCKRGVRVIFETLDGNIGEWRGATNTIALDPCLSREPLCVTATVLCHEMVHAKYGYDPTYPTTTLETRQAFEEEIHACALEAVVWRQLRESFLFLQGATACRATYQAYCMKRLPSLIMEHKSYQREYFGRPLKVKGN